MQYYKPDGGYMVLVSLSGVQILSGYPLPPRIANANDETWFLINESKQSFPHFAELVPY